jgi:hypothetical protein
MFDNGGCIYLFLKKPNASSSLASIFDIPFFSFYDTVWSGAHLRYESGMDSRSYRSDIYAAADFAVSHVPYGHIYAGA